MIVQVRTWLGVPYATPPVAALRFRPPRPVLRASGEIDNNRVKKNIGWIKIEKTLNSPFFNSHHHHIAIRPAAEGHIVKLKSQFGN